ncbi:MAG: hemerythrin domain-containing protein [Rhodanobacteraceae bacterium]
MDIERFKRDHVALMRTVGELRGLVHAGIAPHADAIAHELVAMSAAVKLHLAAEDHMLYPALAADVRTQDIGERYQTEMGSLAQTYGEFVKRWSFAAQIADDPETFRAEANTVFKALHQRVQRENRELYPLVERL